MLYFWFLMTLGGKGCRVGLPTHTVREVASLFLQHQAGQEQHLQQDKGEALCMGWGLQTLLYCATSS